VWLLATFGGFWFALLSLGIVGGFTAYSAYEFFSQDLPPIDDIHNIEFETTRIYDRYGNLLYEMFDEDQGKRTYIAIDQMPKHLIEATIATEDKSFEQNVGVDLEGIARAAYINITNQGQSGGSTITQQVVRRILLPEKDERTFTRKIREALLAMRVTEKYSKDKILEVYLNEISYGSLSYGVAAAADTYFGKKVKDLTLAESAMLAGLPQAPGEYDPNINFELARARQQIVLGLMVKNGYITQVEADTAYAEDVRPLVRAANVPRNAPHFVQYVKTVLEEQFGPEMAYRGGLKVFTTIDLNMQAEAQRIAAQQIEAIKRQGASNAGLVAINPRTGEILAMVGSVDYTDPFFGEVNVATALRQPGSSFKPITYATGFQRGDFHPLSVVPDLPAKYTNGAGLLPYIPQNYDGRFHGPVTIRAALANSYNIPAVEMLKELGVPAVLKTAHKMGITTLEEPERYGLALTLGGGEVTLLDMTTAYATFANYGKHVPTTPFLKIADAHGNILYELDRERTPGEQVLDSGVAYQISNILSDNAARSSAFGPNSPLKIDGIEAAAKTGTTNDWKDSWTMGYTPALAVGVWVGNNDGRAMAHVAGAIGAAPIWHNFIVKVYSDPKLKALLYRPNEQELPETFFPKGVVRAPVCAVSGMVPGPACTSVRYEWFSLVNKPEEVCTWHRWVPVTLHDGGGSVAGPGVPASDVIERVYTFPPQQFKGWIGGGPPGSVTIITPTAQVVALPTPLAEEPPPVVVLVTPVANLGGSHPVSPVGLQQPEELDPIPGLLLSISSPRRGEVVGGLVSITGQAQATDFARYTLEYGVGDGSTGMANVVSSDVPDIFGQLGYWNTDGLAPGPYTLRLTLETTLGQVVRIEVPVRIGTGEPTVSIMSPTDGAGIYDGEAVNINVAADGGGAALAGVEVYADGKRIASILAPPYVVPWGVLTGTHELYAMAYTVVGEQARSLPVRVTAAGPRPSPTATRAPVLWISNLTVYKEIQAGVNEVWVDVAPGSPVHHVDIYVNGYPAGYATGPGYRVNPKWTPTPTLPPTQPPTPTIPWDVAATATEVQKTVNAQSTRTAVVQATRTARANATATAKANIAAATAQSEATQAAVAALTASPTALPPTDTPLPSPTPTFVRYERLMDPMLGDFVARCQFRPGRHRITAIGYDEQNREVGRNETWVVVK
jgi:1A family penicillin-binding protein